MDDVGGLELVEDRSGVGRTGEIAILRRGGEGVQFGLLYNYARTCTSA